MLLNTNNHFSSGQLSLAQPCSAVLGPALHAIPLDVASRHLISDTSHPASKQCVGTPAQHSIAQHITYHSTAYVLQIDTMPCCWPCVVAGLSVMLQGQPHWSEELHWLWPDARIRAVWPGLLDTVALQDQHHKQVGLWGI